MPATYTLKDMQKLAQSRGGRCLSKAYQNMRTHLTWKCELGHVWQAMPTNVISHQSWCPVCGRERIRQHKIGKSRLTEEGRRQGLAKLKAAAAAHGGKCLSSDYIGRHKQYRFRCKQRHEWETSAGIIFNGKWCARCAHDRNMHSLADLQAVAEKKGGRCLSRKYLGANKSHLFICVRDHRWSTQPSNIFRGTWCLACYLDSRRGTLEEMRAIAESRGGKCLSLKYINTKTHLLWECHRGHQWRAAPRMVKSGTWCPQCAIRERSEGAEHKPKTKRVQRN